MAYPEPDGGFSGGFNDEWRVGILVLDADGRTKASFQRPVTFTGAWKPSAHGTFVVNEVIDVPSKPVTFRVGVTSRALGKTGTAHIHVDVPDYRDRELRVSPLVLGAAKHKVDAAIGLDRLRPLVPFQPATRRTFSPEESLRVFGYASWRSSDAAVSFELSIVGAAASVPDRFTGTGVLGQARSFETTVDRSLSLRALPPGAYVLRLVAKLSSGAAVVRDVPFSVTAN